MNALMNAPDGATSDGSKSWRVLLALPVSAILSVAIRELRQSYLTSMLYNN